MNEDGAEPFLSNEVKDSEEFDVTTKAWKKVAPELARRMVPLRSRSFYMIRFLASMGSIGAVSFAVPDLFYNWYQEHDSDYRFIVYENFIYLYYALLMLYAHKVNYQMFKNWLFDHLFTRGAFCILVDSHHDGMWTALQILTLQTFVVITLQSKAQVEPFPMPALFNSKTGPEMDDEPQRAIVEQYVSVMRILPEEALRICMFIYYREVYESMSFWKRFYKQRSIHMNELISRLVALDADRYKELQSSVQGHRMYNVTFRAVYAFQTYVFDDDDDDNKNNTNWLNAGNDPLQAHCRPVGLVSFTFVFLSLFSGCYQTFLSLQPTIYDAVYGL